MIINFLSQNTLSFLTVISLLGFSQTYEIKEFRNIRNLNMNCAGTQKLYIQTKNRKMFTAMECSAFVMKDSYYYEYLIPLSVFQRQELNSINVCSADSSLFMSTNDEHTSPKKKKCQNLKIRARDGQYVYAGYTTPTCRLDGLNKPICYTSE
jgi:hypothetical protein